MPNKNPKLFKCSNPHCDNKVSRFKWQIEPSGNVYCSHSCAAKITNRLRVSNKKPRSKCKLKKCNNKVNSPQAIYCSRKCRFEDGFIKKAYTKEGIIKKIVVFNHIHKRIPFKVEMPKIYRPARRLFGTWNKAIIASGLFPNPTKFSHKHIANDGHLCDSLSEKLLDDQLYEANIPHQIHPKYPFNNKMRADFKVDNLWVEYFGLRKNLLSYDQSLANKLKLAKKHKINLVSIYLEDLRNKKRMNSILNFIQKNKRALQN